MPAPLVEAHELSRRYGRRWALARVELEVRAGESLLVIGQNGSGKTTLLRLLATATLPTRGALRLFGLEPTGALWSIRSRLAFLTHLPALYEDLSASDNLRILARVGGRPDHSEQWLARVGLEPRPEPVFSYSAGMRKRLAFARILAQDPELVLVDEPYGQLDPEGFSLVDGLVRELVERGVTVILASHLVERASRLCERALLLHHGVPRWSGPASDASRAWQVLHQGSAPAHARGAG